MNFFRDFNRNSTLQGYFNITALKHITACLFSFGVAFTHRPARQFWGHPQQWDHHLQGFKSSRLFLYASSHICCNLTSFFRLELLIWPVVRLVYNDISTLVSTYSWHQEGFLSWTGLIKLSDSPILPDSARNDFWILPWEFSRFDLTRIFS